jgi:hypothetical protein
MAEGASSNNRWRGPWGVSSLAPRALWEIVRPRRPSGVVVRPLNFTVRRHASARSTAVGY